jgi:hypothetical protein
MLSQWVSAAKLRQAVRLDETEKRSVIQVLMFGMEAAQAVIADFKW